MVNTSNKSFQEKQIISSKENKLKGIKFEDYTNRPRINTRYENNDVVSYISSEKKFKIKTSFVNFSKSLDRDKVNKIYNTPNIPAPCFYKPQFDYVLPSLSKNCKNLTK